jgi:arylsulfatase A-like enzyme
VFSEYDYSMMPARRTLGTPVDASRLFMVFDGRWKYIHAVGFRPMLYDLENDPEELRDRGADSACSAECARLKDALLAWSLRDHNRITMPDARIAGYSEAAQLKAGIVIGFWDQPELDRAKGR